MADAKSKKPRTQREKRAVEANEKAAVDRERLSMRAEEARAAIKHMIWLVEIVTGNIKYIRSDATRVEVSNEFETDKYKDKINSGEFNRQIVTGFCVEGFKRERFVMFCDDDLVDEWISVPRRSGVCVEIHRGELATHEALAFCHHDSQKFEPFHLYDEWNLGIADILTSLETADMFRAFVNWCGEHGFDVTQHLLQCFNKWDALVIPKPA